MRSSWGKLCSWFNVAGVPIKKGEFGHRHTLVGSVLWTEDRDWGVASTSQETPQIARRTVEAGREPRPDLPPVPSVGAESSQHLDLASKLLDKRFLLFEPPILVLCYGRPRKLIPAPPIPKPETWEPPRPSLSLLSTAPSSDHVQPSLALSSCTLADVYPLRSHRWIHQDSIRELNHSAY